MAIPVKSCGKRLWKRVELDVAGVVELGFFVEFSMVANDASGSNDAPPWQMAEPQLRIRGIAKKSRRVFMFMDL